MRKNPELEAPSENGFRKPGSRLLFVDLFRFIALFLMVQGHVFRSLVDTDLTRTFFWLAHESVHKFTAAIFLFGSGLIFMIVTRRRWVEYKGFGYRTRRRLRRYLFFLIIAYWLHLPFMSLAATIQKMCPQLLARMTVVDVLHIISVGLILLQLLAMLIRKPDRMRWILFPLGFLFLALAPFINPLSINGPTPLVSWLIRDYGSRFTVMPWWGYLFWGAALGSIFPESGDIRLERRFVNVLAFTGLALVFTGVAIAVLSGLDFVYAEQYRPDQITVRLGVVFALLGACWYLERWGVARKLKGAFFLSEESLIVYVVHLIIVYGSVLSPGMAQLIGNRLGIPWVVVSFLAVSAVTVGFTWVWHWLKKKHLTVLKIMQALMVAAFIVVFLLRKW